MRARESFVAFGFLTPSLIVFGLFMFLPLGLAFVISTTNSSGFGLSRSVGLANYRELFADPIFWRSFVNTCVYTAITVPLAMGMGLGVAILLNGPLPGRNFFRSSVYFPLVVSGVATALVGGFMFDENQGVANKMLASLGFGPIHWQSNGIAAMASLVLITLWVSIGFNMVVYLAALQGIDRSYYDAADVEGATRWQGFRFIVWPLLGPVTFFLMIMNVIASFQVFDIVYVMTGGGPVNDTQMLVTYAYQNGFVIRRQGYAAAIGVFIYLVMLTFTGVQWRLSKRRDAVMG